MLRKDHFFLFIQNNTKHHFIAQLIDMIPCKSKHILLHYLKLISSVLVRDTFHKMLNVQVLNIDHPVLYVSITILQLEIVSRLITGF